jgi:hypothetical protein
MLMERKKSWLALAAGADSFRMRKKHAGPLEMGWS